MWPSLPPWKRTTLTAPLSFPPAKLTLAAGLWAIPRERNIIGPGGRCPYLHRTTGDTERKYHLRYYKTGTCIHETDARGHCVKNGLHCAFAHGPLDLRPPVCDVRELQAQEALQNGQLGSGEGVPDLQPGVLASQAMIEKILSEDPRWQDANFVLGSYKTEQCPKPPRLCRQGYACPHYHNSRDRRRNPRRFQYRSTPCPSVKHGDEWGEPARCDGGDGCQYCHSRTEQQFHPEIYKSTKCNDMRQTGYCPRGPFCAFAHIEKSLGMVNDWGCRDLHLTSPASTGSGQPGNAKRRDSPAEGGLKGSEQDSKQNHLAVFAAVHPPAPSVSSSVASSLASSAGSGSSSPTALPAPPTRALPLSPAGSTVEAVLGSALDPHLSNVNIASLEKDLEEQDGHDLGPAGARSLAGSAPVTIPGSLPRAPSLHSPSSASTSPLSSLSQPLPGPVGSSAMTPPQQPPPLRSEPGALGSSASSFSSLGLNGVPGSIWDFVSGSFSPSPTPILSAGPPSSSGSSPNGTELARVRRQLDEAKRKIRQWEESWQQVKQVCDAWQREAQEAKERARVADSDRQLALQKKEEVEAQVKQLQEELEGLGVASTLPGLRGCADIGTIPLPKLHSLQSQLRLDLEAVDGVSPARGGVRASLSAGLLSLSGEGPGWCGVPSPPAPRVCSGPGEEGTVPRPSTDPLRPLCLSPWEPPLLSGWPLPFHPSLLPANARLHPPQGRRPHPSLFTAATLTHAPSTSACLSSPGL
uniref:Unk like zinc finger n=1 Tax=Macaca mulatta TaxID=9544 RepID=H9H3J7_MACMU